MNPNIRSQLIRASLQSADDSGPQQLVKVTGIAGQTIGEAVRSQHFGMSSHPPSGSEGLMLALGGGLDRAHFLGAEHPSHRPTGLGAGAVTVYDAHGNKSEYSANGIKHTDAHGNVIESNSGKITVKPASSSVNVYVGGDGATGTYAVLATVSGPCLPNILGRIA